MAPITKEECFRLARAARAGDRAARDRLVVSHLPLAKAEARRFFRYCGRGTDPEDLMAEATRILVEQADRFEPEREVPFRAYMAMQLRYRLWNHLRRKVLNRALTEAETLEDDSSALLGENPTDEAIQRADLRQAMGEVEERILRALAEGISYQRVRCHLDLPEDTYKAAMARLRAAVLGE